MKTFALIYRGMQTKPVLPRAPIGRDGWHSAAKKARRQKKRRRIQKRGY